MAKITTLPNAGPLTGDEPVILVQGAEARQAPIGALVEQVSAPFVSQAQAARDAILAVLEVLHNLNGYLDDLPGYRWGVVDKNGQIALGVNPSGETDLLPSAYTMAAILAALGFPADTKTLLALTSRLVNSAGPLDDLPGYRWGIADKVGQVALGVTSAGETDLILTERSRNILAEALNLNASSLAAYEKQLGDTFGTIFSTTTDVVPGANTDEALARINGYTAAYRIRRDYADPSWKAIGLALLYHPHNGQSLSMGGGAGSMPVGEEVRITEPPNPQHGLMFNTGTRGAAGTLLDGATLTGFVPAYEVFDGTNQGETQGSGLMSWMHRNALANDLPLRPQLYRTHGKSDTGIDGLNKGTNPYTNGLTELTRAIAISAKYGMEVFCPFIHWTHGNADANASMSRASYKSKLIQLFNDYRADFGALLPVGHRDVCMMTDQLRGGSSAAYAEIAVAQWEAARDTDGIYMVGPLYMYDTADGTHLTPLAYDLLGEQRAKVAARILDGVDWKPLSPASVTRSGPVITLTLDVPVAPIVLDTTALAAQTNFGFVYTDDSSSATISTVEVTGDNEITITLSATPSGANKKLRYAYGITRGNVRDSDETPSYALSGYKHRNWLIAFEEGVS